jgi:hypothetical protein
MLRQGQKGVSKTPFLYKAKCLKNPRLSQELKETKGNKGLNGTL